MLIQFPSKSRWWLCDVLSIIGRTLGPTWIQLVTSRCDDWLRMHFFHLCIFLSSSLAEMEKWMEDIKVAIETAKTSNGPSPNLLTSNLTDNSKSLHEHTAEYEMFTSVCSAVWQKVEINRRFTVTVRKYNILSKNNTGWSPSYIGRCLICGCTDTVCVLAPLCPRQPAHCLAVTTSWLSQNAPRTPRWRRSLRTTLRRRTPRWRGPPLTVVTPWCTCAGTGTPVCPWWTLA